MENFNFTARTISILLLAFNCLQHFFLALFHSSMRNRCDVQYGTIAQLAGSEVHQWSMLYVFIGIYTSLNLFLAVLKRRYLQ